MTLSNENLYSRRYHPLLGGVVGKLWCMECLKQRATEAGHQSLVGSLNKMLSDLQDKGYLKRDAKIASGRDRIALELGKLLMEADRRSGVTPEDLTAWVEAARGAADAIVDKRRLGQPTDSGRTGESDRGRLRVEVERLPEGVSSGIPGVAEVAAGSHDSGTGREASPARAIVGASS